MNNYGFARIAVCSPEVAVGNPPQNLANTLEMLDQREDADIVLFPELGISGYTCGDLFHQTNLLQEVETAVAQIVEKSRDRKQLIVIGAPVPVGPELFNCAIAINNGRIVGIVPKQNIPNYKEFYEGRWFAQADGDEPKLISYTGHSVPFGIDLLFQGDGHRDFVVAIEICEDLWMPIPPSSYAAIAGANVLLNLSASNETVAKNEYRMELIRNQSGRCLAAYAYASAGPTESTSDLVFSGHCVIAENGSTLLQSSYVGDGTLDFGKRAIFGDVDVEKLAFEKRTQSSFGEARKSLKREYRYSHFQHRMKMKSLYRKVTGTPFVPSDPATLAARCAAVFDIQCAGLAKRLKHLNYPNVSIGVSGGLDSTHALLVLHKTLQAAGQPLSKIKAITMPGFGTTDKTKGIAEKLMKALGVEYKVIDIRQSCLLEWQKRGVKPFGIDVENMSLEIFNQMLKQVPPEKRQDLDFENTQARERTNLLMNSGFVLGTGDLSELALGWCTYNGDHMSMYNVNASVPKTLIRFLVEYVAKNQYPAGDVRDALIECAGLTISPELLPPSSMGEIEQSTEGVLGPYTLHDFFLFNFVRNGFSTEKIMFLAEHAGFTYDTNTILKTQKTFYKRFMTQQFKRDCVPNGPKVGSVSLSPRGDWRMPVDVDGLIWGAR